MRIKKNVSLFKQHIDGVILSIQPLCLFGEFDPLTNKVIIDRVVLVAISLIVHWLFFMVFCSLSCSLMVS